ncbi:EpsG family protein [Bacillus sp. AFS040349]|uniref:EpsG family protein n=1 Tax=Bacillus sp. AFS040349 TaxID=2033502 RepID=UPI000BFB2A2A|nr:EpsG family protein [Bacillus sp. AFS040349]PGT89046.1 hypothetical protein COD11_05055 [Bacillus sp. AFS040349]
MFALLIASFFFLITSFIFPREKLNYYFLLISFILAIIGFFVVPNNTMDLYKHYQVLEAIRISGIEVVSNHNYYDSLPIFRIYFYLISFLQYNGFLPAITVFITYALTFKTIYKLGIRYNVSKLGMLLAMLFFVGTFNYLGLLSGIRNMLAFSVFAYFLYIDLVEKKNSLFCWLIYILLCFFHSSTVVLVLFRLLLYLYNKFTGKIINIVLIAWSFGSFMIINMLDSLTDIKLFKLLIMQIEGYSTLDYYPIIPAISKYLILITIMITFLYFMNVNKSIKELKGITRFSALIIAFTIGSITNYHIFVRFVNFLIFLSPIYIMLISKNIYPYTSEVNHAAITWRQTSKNKKLTKSILVLLIISISLLSILYLFVFQYRYIQFS